ncbi:MAG: hypothetical protein ACOCZD_00540 [Haloferacaceae archaeon]
MTRRRLAGLVVVGCLALIVATAGASAGLASGDTAIGSPASQIEEAAQVDWDDAAAPQVDDARGNSTRLPHERPGSVARVDASAALEERVAERLTDRLTRSAALIGSGEYEDARGPVTDGYEEELSRYIDVYQRAETGDLQQVEQREDLFSETARLQVRYAETLSEYRRVNAEYEDAREAGDRDRAQRRARELNDLSRELQRTDEALSARYRELDDTAPGSLETASASIDETTEETTRRTEAVVRESYTATELTAEADSSGSFTDPIRITGSLTAPGEEPPNGTVSFLVNDRVHNASVASDGSFTLRYRPVTDPVGEGSIDVAYAPNDSAPYLSSSTNVTTSITQDSPTVSIRNASETTRAGSPVTASGQVTADGVAVPNTSVELSVGDRRLAETRTDDDGEYRFDTDLPVEVTTGTRTLTVRAGTDDAAVGAASEETEVVVEETETRLSLSAVRADGSVTVSGELLAGTETAVGGENVTVSVAGEPGQSVRTTEDGSYEAVVELPESVNESDSVPVRAEFNGTGTNLGGSTVGASVAPAGQGPLPDVPLPLVGVLGAATGFLLIGAYGVYRYRRNRHGRADGRGSSTPPESPTTASASPFRGPEGASASEASPFDRADRHLEVGDARTATLVLYEAVRRELDREETSAGDHWEFFEATADRLSDAQRSVFRDLTEAFEAVRFAGAEPDPGAVAALVTEAHRLFPERDGSATAGTHEDDD